MTRDIQIPPEVHIERFENACRERKLKITQQRLEVFRELARYPGHPTADDIYGRVSRRLKTISLDTVYRTIATFEERGVVSRVQVLDDRGRFDSNLAVHHHMVCTKCKKIEDFYWPAFDEMHVPNTIGSWGEIDSRHVELRGLCKDCRRKARKK